MKLSLLAIALFVFSCLPVKAERLPYIRLTDAPIILELADSTILCIQEDAVQNIRPKNKKLIAALLAFPFPFGIVGLHRIYLGCAPHVPVAYIATVGGGFGLLPLTDFFVILFSKNTTQFVNNGQVFMWLR